jgi:hypothetical protein
MPCAIVVEGEVATLRVTLDESAASPVAPELLELTEEQRKELEDELTDEARRLLASDDVSVTLSWSHGSLEIAALIACGKVVADIGTFLTGVREIRDLLPERIRAWISARVEGGVIVRGTALEIERGLLRGKAEDSTGGEDSNAFSPKELGWYAALSLAVLFVVGALVIWGVSAFL